MSILRIGLQRVTELARGSRPADDAPARTLSVHLPRLFWLMTLSALAWGLLRTVTSGADYSRYQEWAAALTTSDIFRIRSEVGSPLGVPLSVHSAGPGMMISAADAWFGAANLPARSDLFLIWLEMGCAWWALVRIMLRLTSGNVKVVAFVTALGFLGTHLGHFSSVYSSEAMSLFALGVLFYFALASDRPSLFDAVVIGALSGLAVLIRAQLAMYVALPLLVMLYRAYQQHGKNLRFLLLGLFAGVPLAIALVEVAFLNRWMSGSWLRSPYQFGDELWQSVDWSHPLLWTVLTHFRHGLLAYHPFYLVGFAALVYLLVRARDLRERVVLGAAVLIVLSHLYLQAAWFGWWLGSGTFGMRGMATVALLVLPPLAVVLHQRQQAGQRVWPIVVVSVVSSAWGALHYCQGVSNFVSWAELWALQLSTLHEIYPSLLAAGLASGLIAWFRRKSPQRALLAPAAAVFALTLALASGGWMLQGLRDWGWSVTQSFLGWSACVLALAAAFTAAVEAQPRARPAWRLTELGVGLFALALLATSSVQFFSLAHTTEATIREGNTPEPPFVSTSTILWEEMIGNYNDYLTIPGFEREKADVEAFMNRHRDEWKDVKIRSSFRRHDSPRRRPSRRHHGPRRHPRRHAPESP